MFEFHWDLPSSTQSHQVRLQIHARSGWIGRKVLQLDGRTVYRRRWFAGIDHTFAHPSKPQTTVELRAENLAESHRWAPVLRCGGTLVPETTRHPPPPVPDRPQTVSIVVGVTYLAMFLLVVMLQHIPKMLDAVCGHSDIRAYTLEVVKPGDPTELLRLAGTDPPRAALSQPYEAALAVEGGSPPYKWEQVSGRMPAGLTFDPTDGTIRGRPTAAGNRVIGLRVTDATGAQAQRSYVVSVHAAKPGYPQLVTRSLPTAEPRRPYSAPLGVVGGRSPYRWVVNDGKLPHGLEFTVNDEAPASDGAAAALAGTPANGTAGLYVVELRVTDSAYRAMDDVAPWLVPFGAASICLLGFWNMRRWSVPVFALLILVQIALGLSGAAWYPFSATAVVLQGMVWLVGAAHFARMH